MITRVYNGGLEVAVSGTISLCKLDIAQELLIEPRPGFIRNISDIWRIANGYCSYQRCKNEASNHNFYFVHIILHGASLSREIMDVDRLL